jgi:hypothetical protein
MEGFQLSHEMKKIDERVKISFLTAPDVSYEISIKEKEVCVYHFFKNPLKVRG